MECSWSGDLCGYEGLPQEELQWYKPFRPIEAPGVPISDAEKGITGEVYLPYLGLRVYRLRIFNAKTCL